MGALTAVVQVVLALAASGLFVAAAIGATLAAPVVADEPQLDEEARP